MTRRTGNPIPTRACPSLWISYLRRSLPTSCASTGRCGSPPCPLPMNTHGRCVSFQSSSAMTPERLACSPATPFPVNRRAISARYYTDTLLQSRGIATVTGGLASGWATPGFPPCPPMIRAWPPSPLDQHLLQQGNRLFLLPGIQGGKAQSRRIVFCLPGIVIGAVTQDKPFFTGFLYNNGQAAL